MLNEARQLGLTVNGLPLCGADPAAYATQAAVESLSDAELAQLEWLRDPDGPAIGVIDDHFDNVRLWLSALGLRSRMLAAEDLVASEVELAFVGCPHRFARLDVHQVDAFLDRGGVLVTSDRATMMDGVGRWLPDAGGRAPRRARLEIAGEEQESIVAPAVWLHGGHRELHVLDAVGPDLQILATDGLSGEPLVVMRQVGAGRIVHSVAHWLQSGVEQHLTAVDRRPLREISRYAHCGNSYPDLTLGAFLTARAMLRVFLAGLPPRPIIDRHLTLANLQLGEQYGDAA